MRGEIQIFRGCVVMDSRRFDKIVIENDNVNVEIENEGWYNRKQNKI